MNACMNQHASSDHYEVGRYVENLCPGIRLRLATTLLSSPQIQRRILTNIIVVGRVRDDRALSALFMYV